jgi:alcohol acetyltransferase
LLNRLTSEIIIKPQFIGAVERRCIIRESLDFYRSLAVGGIYQFSGNHDLTSITTYTRALRRCIEQHPHLSATIEGIETETPYYAFCPQLDLNKHIKILKNDTSDEQNEVKTIERILPGILDKPWPKGSPPWKVYLLPFSQTRCFICLGYSHGLLDGIAGIAFHRTLLDALSQQNVSVYDIQDPIYKPTKKHLPPPFDTAKNLPISWPYLLSPFLAHYLPKFVASSLGLRDAVNILNPGTWLATPIFSKTNANQTGVEIIAIDAITLDKTLKLCRANGARLTGLLHQLIVSALSDSLPETSNVDSFASQTAINMRSAVGTSNDEMGLFSSGVFETFPVQRRSLDGQKPPTSSHPFDWSIAKSMTHKLVASTGTLEDQPIGLLRYLVSIRSWLLSKLGHQRDCSYEVSNIMAFRPLNKKPMASCEVKEMYFCQPAHIVSAPLCFNIVSVADGGALNICVDWQIGAILGDGQEAAERNFVSQVCKHIKDSFRELAE